MRGRIMKAVASLYLKLNQGKTESGKAEGDDCSQKRNK